MIRTGYSFKTAAGHLPQVMSRMKETGFPAAPIADRNSTFGFTKWTKLCTKESMKPVYGVELGVCHNIGEKKLTIDYWTFLAKDSLRPLHELIYLATSRGKEPCLKYEEALEARGVFKIAGERVIVSHLYFQPDDFFVGLSPATSRGLYASAKQAGCKFLRMDNNYFPRASDREFYRILLGKRSNSATYPQHIMDDAEWLAEIDRIGAGADAEAAIDNRNMVLQACNATLKKATLLSPEKPKTLRQMCEEGAAILGCDLTDPIYKARLERELSLIEEKKFEDYFYIVADLVQWAKERMVVGPGRGSSSGSLVCYLLRITSIDPIPFGLLFERFIDITRNDLPDIDIDFDDEQRERVFEYAERKYGKAHVARLGTVAMMQPDSILNNIGTALRIPKWQIEKVKETRITRSPGDSRAMLQIEDTFAEVAEGKRLITEYPEAAIAKGMEGHPSNAGQHAAGIILTVEPIIEYVAVDKRTNSTMCDKRDAEELGLLKIDALGLTQLSVFGRTLELIGKPKKSGILEQIPLDDTKAYEVLRNLKFSGIFQFTGRSLKTLVQRTSIEHLDDMVAITSLARPGPMGSGGADTWAKRRVGKEPVAYPHEMLKPYLEETLGIVVLQEQVMRICRELGEMSWKDVTALRKAMSKSLGAEHFDQYGDPWKAKVIEKGLPPEVANSFWKDLCKFGLYGFNKSHAVAYSIVSYWCCWLKAHHPFEFAAATLDSIASTQRQLEFLRELGEEGISYVAVDKDHSGAKWQPVTRADGSRVLVGPLSNVKGIGPEAVKAILAAREDGRPLKPGHAKLLENPKTEIDTLTPINDHIQRAVGDLAAKNIVSTPMPIKDIQLGVPGEVMFIGVLEKINVKDENEAINIERRKAWGGTKYEDGMTNSLSLFFKDDTGEIFCRVNRYDFERIGRDIVDRGKPGLAVYAVKGMVGGDFRMVKVKGVRYLCDLEARISSQWT